VAKFAAFIERPKVKSASALGGLRPLTHRVGALPLDPAGGSDPDPRYRLALPRSPWGRAPQIFRARTATANRSICLQRLKWRDRWNDVIPRRRGRTCSVPSDPSDYSFTALVVLLAHSQIQCDKLFNNTTVWNAGHVKTTLGDPYWTTLFYNYRDSRYPAIAISCTDFSIG